MNEKPTGLGERALRAWSVYARSLELEWQA